MRAINLLETIIQKEKSQIDQEFIARTNFLNSKIIKFLAPIRNLFVPSQNITYLIQAYNQYHIGHQEKIIALNHLLYILTRNPIIPYQLFPKKDHLPINKYLKNQFLSALSNQLNPKKLSFLPTHTNYGLNLVNQSRIRNTTIIDCGAFTGNTILLFNQVLKPKKIIALEPDPANFQKLKQTLKTNSLNHVLALQTAVSSSKKTVNLALPGTAGAHLSPQQTHQPLVPVNTIDNLVKKHKLQNIKLIKMDIEGSELEALKGAKKTIQKHQPTLIISAYHQGHDIFEIPPLIHQLNPNYQLRFINLSSTNPTADKVIIAQ